MKNPVDLTLYLVTNRGSLSLDDFIKIIIDSADGGVTLVQIREKELPAREMILIGKQLLSLLKPRGIPLIINDRVDVAHAVGADGVHLGQSDLTVREARAILGQRAIIGISIESLEQAKEAAYEDVDYLAASPVFATNTKQDCSKPWGLSGLKELCSIAKRPVVAIGGIQEWNVKQVMDAGAEGVAVVSAIFDAPCPKAAARTILNRMR